MSIALQTHFYYFDAWPEEHETIIQTEDVICICLIISGLQHANHAASAQPGPPRSCTGGVKSRIIRFEAS